MRKLLKHNFEMSAVITPVAYNPPTITVEAARRAAAGSGKRKIASGVINNLAKKSRRMASEFQEDMEKHVKRKLDSMSGSQDNRKLGLKVAQFIPGKGLEVRGAQVENDPAIYCSLGLKGQKHVDPLDETFSRIKGRQLSMDFAFKLVNDTSSLLDHDKDTRITTMNCFRHVNPKSFIHEITGWHPSVNGEGISSIIITNGGVYSSGNFQTLGVTVSLTGGGNGSGVVFGTPVFTSVSGGWTISSVAVTLPGSGYSSTPSVVFTPNSTTTEVTPAEGIAVLTHINEAILSNYNWHSTLGPDASLIRVGTNGVSQSNPGYAGTWRGLDHESVNQGVVGALDQSTFPLDQPTSPANTLMSPFRYPKDMEVMYSRVNRQLLENYGWLLNPFKFVNPSLNATDATAYPSRNSLNVWSNPGEEFLDFHDTSEVTSKKNSFPAKINLQDADVMTQQSLTDSGAGFEWHSQFGPGKLSYQFSNDGTNPVCIDICVVGIKKDSTVHVDQLKAFCDFNYSVHKYANKNTTDVNGFQTGSSGSFNLNLGNEEWHKNAKLPFMPDECFKNPQNYVDAFDYDPSVGCFTPAHEVFSYLSQGKKNPFKVVKRDQFIVSSGSSRSWNTTLPSIKYRPQVYGDIEFPLATNVGPEEEMSKIVTTADEYTFVLCIGASGMPKPVEEIYSSNQPTSLNSDGTVNKTLVDAKAIIDRQPSTCNVSVVGTYKETVYPCYPKDRTSVNFINGRLTEPYYTNPPGLLVPITNDDGSIKVPLQKRVNTVDISQLGQVVHTSPNGIVGVGAITTEIGA